MREYEPMCAQFLAYIIEFMCKYIRSAQLYYEILEYLYRFAIFLSNINIAAIIPMGGADDFEEEKRKKEEDSIIRSHESYDNCIAIATSTRFRNLRSFNDKTKAEKQIVSRKHYQHDVEM